MNAAETQVSIDRIAAGDGVLGCALVEIEAGMIWLSAGQNPHLPLYCEAISDYWRLSERLNKHLPDTGQLKNLSLQYQHLKIASWRLNQGLIFVLLLTQSQELQWEKIKPLMTDILLKTKK